MKMNENLKSILSPKVIVFSVIVLIFIVYFLFKFLSGEESANSKEKVLVKNEKPQSKEFFEGYKTGKGRASLFSDDTQTILQENNTINIIDKTDDEDALLIQNALREDKGTYNTSAVPDGGNNVRYYSGAANESSYTPKPISEIPKQQQKIVPDIDTVPEPEQSQKKNRFYEGRRRETKGNTLSCAVHGEQEIMNGSTLKLRLLEDYITPQGRKIEKGTTLWGVCTLSKERMHVAIQSVLIGKDLVDMNLEAYDLDGLKGINLPNNVKAEIAKRVKAQSIQEAPTDEILDNNNGILEKSANTVANAAKNLLSRKQEEIKITVKSNYNLLLKSQKR